MKKHIAIVSVLLCSYALSAQNVMVTKGDNGSKNYPSSFAYKDRGIVASFGWNFLSMSSGKLNDYASTNGEVSFNAKVMYQLNKNWRFGVVFNNAAFKDKKPYATFDGLMTGSGNPAQLSGYPMHYFKNYSFMGGAEYGIPVSRWFQPFVGFYLGAGSVEQRTEIGDTYAFGSDKWRFGMSPELGFRSFMDRNQTLALQLYAKYTYFAMGNDNEMLRNATTGNYDINNKGASFFNVGFGFYVFFL